METPVRRGRPKTPAAPVIVKWEYMTLSNERPVNKTDYNTFGSDGWELVAVYVRMDAVYAVFKREVV